MEAPDTISTTSSSSKTSSNEAGARSDSTSSNSNNATTAVSRSKRPLDDDMVQSFLQRLKEPATTTPSSPSSNSNSNSNSNSAGDLHEMAAAALGPLPLASTASTWTNEAAADCGSSGAAAAVPVWSQEPVVNVLAILLILKDLEESRQDQAQPQQQQPVEERDHKNKTETSNLVHTLLARLEELGGENADELARTLMGKDLGKFVGQMVSLANRNTNKPSEATATTASESVSNKDEQQSATWSSSKSNSNSNSSSSNSNSSNSKSSSSMANTSDDSKLPAKSKNNKRSHDEVVTALTIKAREEAAAKDDADMASKKKKPTRQELLEALQQHLDILHQRGQVSSVIPVFLRSAKTGADTKEDEQSQDDEDDAQSTSSTLAVRKAKRRKKSPTKDQYYEDLAAEVLAAHTPGPVPETISFSVPAATATSSHCLPTLQETGETLTESEDSISLCSSSGDGSSPNSSDFESSTADTKTTGTNSDAVQGRTVTFAKDAVVEKKCSSSAKAAAPEAPEAHAATTRAVSVSSGSSEEQLSAK